jgi:hypothetical protein
MIILWSPILAIVQTKKRTYQRILEVVGPPLQHPLPYTIEMTTILPELWEKQWLKEQIIAHFVKWYMLAHML